MITLFACFILGEETRNAAGSDACPLDKTPDSLSILLQSRPGWIREVPLCLYAVAAASERFRVIMMVGPFGA
jgi:hypothetical protein